MVEQPDGHVADVVADPFVENPAHELAVLHGVAAPVVDRRFPRRAGHRAVVDRVVPH
ncbi:hypothetical protein [Halocatena marina]|uniref:Uncharacterized protein n=1 Tax=Halocatena marina TaxID=2934937 RepID=A0ABD5YUL0_9EURY|nr:hypothetical protein [Halocatena marina]